MQANSSLAGSLLLVRTGLAVRCYGHAIGEYGWAHLTLLGDGAVALVLVLPASGISLRRFRALLLGPLIATLMAHVFKTTVPCQAARDFAPCTQA